MQKKLKRAFTIFEVLIVLALMGLLASITMAYGSALFEGVGDEPLADTLRRAVREARFQAVSTGKVVTLTWDEEAATFRLRDADGKDVGTFEADAEPKRDSVVFYQMMPGRGLAVPDVRAERREVASILFSPDRSSTPFAVAIRWAGEESEHRFDPFSNLQIQEER